MTRILKLFINSIISVKLRINLIDAAKILRICYVSPSGRDERGAHEYLSIVMNVAVPQKILKYFS
jgi:hypothetical protein